MARREFDSIKVKDQLGKPDNIGIFGPFKSTENLLVEEGPTIVKFNDVTGMAIWDNPNTTWDGVDTDDEWDSYNEDGQIITRVTNYNNEYIERFAFNTLIGDATTATVDTTNQEVTFTSGQVLEIASAFKDTSESLVVSRCIVEVFGEGDFAVAVSADGGSSWSPELETEAYEFSEETYGSGLLSGYSTSPLDFPATRGSDLRIRITKSGASTGKTTLLKCRYEL